MNDDDGLSSTMIIPNPGGRRTNVNDATSGDANKVRPSQPNASSQQYNLLQF